MDPRLPCATSARRAFPVKLIGDEGTLRGVSIALRPPLRKAGTFKQATRRPRARDKQIGSDCAARTSVSQRVQLETPFYVTKG